MEQQTQEEAFWHDSNIVLHTLLSDLAFIDKQLNGKDDQVWRRAYCRALFALIESGISYLKSYILTFPEGGIDEDTELRLSDKRRIKLKDGSEHIATSFMPFQDSVTFALETFAWFYGLEYQVRKEDSGWKALVTTSKTRNRIVHPKTWADLAISDKEMISLQRARRWFFMQVTRLQRRHLRTMRKGMINAKRWIEKHSDSTIEQVPENSEPIVPSET